MQKSNMGFEMKSFKLSTLPIDKEYTETTAILKKSIQANRYLA